MLKNWIRVFLRTSANRRGFTVLNLTGLSVGIAAALLALLYIQHELSYDRFHNNSDRIYSLAMHIKVGSSDFWTAGVPEALVTSLAETTPGLISAGLKECEPLITRRGAEFFTLEKGYLVTDDFFDLFTFPLSAGDASSFYENPNSIILSSKSAKRLFGNEDAVGQVIESSTSKTLYTIAGVLDPIPKASHLKIDYLLPRKLSSLEPAAWRSLGTKVYFMIPAEREIDKVVQSITTMFRENSTLPSHFLDVENLLQAYPLTGIHLGHIGGETGWTMEYSRLSGVGLLGGIILLLAIINYINLTTAHGLTRAREVGMRKTLGGTRPMLVFQFMAESMLLCIVAMLVALVIAEMALPHFEQLVQREFNHDFMTKAWFIVSSLGLIILIGLLSGLAPALIISAYPSIEVIKGRLITSRRGTFFRAVLVVGQFVLTIGLIGAMTTVHRQLNHMQNADLGFDRDQICYLELRPEEGTKPFTELKREMLAIPGVEAASLSSSAPYCGNLAMAVNYDEEAVTSKTYYNVESDEDFINVFGLELLKGRPLTAADIASNTQYVVVTENSADAFNFGSDPLGKMIDEEDGYEVVGVIRNFPANSAQYEQYPVVLTPPERTPEVLLLRLTPGQFKSTVNQIENTWNRLYPDQPFAINFLDDRVHQAYETERNLSRMITVFTAVALLVAMLGLYGLSLYTTVLRTKEIGVRKILGASSLRIAALLTQQHLRHVLIAIVIATPLTWWIMTKWLEDFSLRIKVGWDMLLLPAVGALFVSLLAVLSHTWRAATANPADSIRTE